MRKHFSEDNRAKYYAGSGSSVAEQQIIHQLLGEESNRTIYDYRIRPRGTFSLIDDEEEGRKFSK